MSEEMTSGSDGRQAQIAELRSLVASGAIDAADYARRRSQILAPTERQRASFQEDEAQIPEPEPLPKLDPLTRRDCAPRFVLSLGLVAALVYAAIALQDAGLGWLLGLIVLLLLTPALALGLYTVVMLLGTIAPRLANGLLERMRDDTDEA